ncbi:tetraspanin-4 isoform X1 [Ciconia boyciana]
MSHSGLKEGFCFQLPFALKVASLKGWLLLLWEIKNYFQLHLACHLQNHQSQSPVCWLRRGHLVNWNHVRCSELLFLHQKKRSWKGRLLLLGRLSSHGRALLRCLGYRGYSMYRRVQIVSSHLARVDNEISKELKRCSMAHNCLQCIKYLMFVFNLLFWLGGCGILGVGIWLAVTQGNFATLSSSFPSLSAANLLIVTGTFVMIIGFVGCIGAIKENKCLLLSFFIMLLIIFLLELTVVILFFVYTDKIDKYAQRDLKKGLHLYGTDGNIGLTNAWSIIQTDFRCCGVSNYTDWFEVYNTTRVPDSCCLEFSENCGLHSPGTWWKAPCYETVKIWLQENLLAVGIFGLCTAMVQILGLTFAMTMYCQVVKADTYCA